MIAIATKWTSGGRRSFARAKLPGNIGPYTTPRMPVEKAFSTVDRTNQMRRFMINARTVVKRRSLNSSVSEIKP
jgi:hypothetical protein